MIDATSQLAALIRAQFAAQAPQRLPPRRIGQSRAAAVPAEPADCAVGAQGPDRSIEALVAMRVRALSPDDPQRRRKAFRIFLESVLARELGRARVDETRFGQLVDDVLGRMEQDASLRQAMQQAADVLLADAQPEQTSRDQ